MVQFQSRDELDLYISRLGYIYSPESETRYLPRLEDMLLKLGRSITIVIPSSVNWVEEGAVTAVKDQVGWGTVGQLKHSVWLMQCTGATSVLYQSV